jgi:GNAT superfamily N-acetyltransferase
MTTQVVDVPDRHRYEIVRDGTTLGYAAYQETEQLIVFTHTEVDPTLEGQGIGGRLASQSLMWAGKPVHRNSSGRCDMSLNTTTVGGRSVKYRSTVRAAWPSSSRNQLPPGRHCRCRGRWLSQTHLRGWARPIASIRGDRRGGAGALNGSAHQLP